MNAGEGEKRLKEVHKQQKKTAAILVRKKVSPVACATAAAAKARAEAIEAARAARLLEERASEVRTKAALRAPAKKGKAAEEAIAKAKAEARRVTLIHLAADGFTIESIEGPRIGDREAIQTELTAEADRRKEQIGLRTVLPQGTSAARIHVGEGSPVRVVAKLSTPAASVRQARAPRVGGPPRVRGRTVASVAREMVVAGSTNEEIFAALQKEFDLPESRHKTYPAFYRYDAVRKCLCTKEFAAAHAEKGGR